jgi:lipoate synthase
MSTTKDFRRALKFAADVQRFAKDMQDTGSAVRMITDETVKTFDHVVENGKKIYEKAKEHMKSPNRPIKVKDAIVDEHGHVMWERPAGR